MNTQADTQETEDNEILDVETPDEELSGEPDAEGEQSAPSDPEAGEGTPEEAGDDEGIDLQFGDEAPPAPTSDDGDNSAMRQMRKRIAEQTRIIKQYEAKEKQVAQPAQTPKLGPKPTLQEFDYDEGKYDAALDKWYETKRAVDAAEAEQRQALEKREAANRARLESYANAASTLKVKDFKDSEDEVVSALSVEQQGILLAGAKNPALLVYALGRYPAKLQQLAQIEDPVRFAFEAAYLEKELKVTPRTATKPAPEGRVSSAAGAPAAGGGEKKLEQLRAEAEKTGDYSKVIAYKKQLKQVQQKRR
ncbi:hypothetical protein B7759_01392 [Burkholderia glumae]|uniref:hypothetical protein n=1 Tax=Burkholderia glumae TaxID=337 RepID=UPI001AE991B7|nr:hypothetical protein [Burkholderia glumae]QTP32814.1 hypothetical protein B7759_01392 [Burkholderia glumae]